MIEKELEKPEDAEPPQLDPDPALRDLRQILKRYKLALELLDEALPLAFYELYALHHKNVTLGMQMDFWIRYSALEEVMQLIDDIYRCDHTDYFFMKDYRTSPWDTQRTIREEIDEIEMLLKDDDEA